jgi:hypothetical protein
MATVQNILVQEQGSWGGLAGWTRVGPAIFDSHLERLKAARRLPQSRWISLSAQAGVGPALPRQKRQQWQKALRRVFFMRHMAQIVERDQGRIGQGSAIILRIGHRDQSVFLAPE